jgi:hypothetical protein
MRPESETGPAAWWTFDEGAGRAAVDHVSRTEDEIRGNFRFVGGISGTALKFDGYTTAVVRQAKKAPTLGGAFSVEAWIAMAAYPWNRCPILTRENEGRGFSFEVGPQGELALRAYVGGWPRECVSQETLPLRAWAHVAGVYEPGRGLRLFINGRPVGETPFARVMDQAKESDMVIGAVTEPRRPSHAVGRGEGTIPSWYALDAVLDELKIRQCALTESECREAAQRPARLPSPNIPPRVMPSGPAGPGRFGAYYTRLKYYWEWDDLWRVGDDPDVIVQFDGSPVRVVFWRGTRYSPAWVTENGLWMADQSAESGNQEGCIEHMQDIHCRYSHVRILENTPARVVVHWRYAPSSSLNHLWITDDRTGWAWWVDETYTFFPDGTGMRKIEWREPDPAHRFPWLQIQETSVLCHPGQESEDVLSRQAITLLNLKGERQVYGWPDDEMPNTRERRNLPADPSIIRDIRPEKPNIQIVNYRSANKPFIIFEPGNRYRVYVGRVRDKLQNFPAYNHWPVNQTNSDGRFAQAADRASSFSIAYSTPVIHQGERGQRWASYLYGMTDKPQDRVVELARSWIQPPELKLEGQTYSYCGYDRSERAYILEMAKAGRISFVLEAGEPSPMVNAFFLIKGWDGPEARVMVDGRPLTGDKEYRTGHLRRLDGGDLLLWIERTSTRPVSIVIEPDEP